MNKKQIVIMAAIVSCVLGQDQPTLPPAQITVQPEVNENNTLYYPPRTILGSQEEIQTAIAKLAKAQDDKINQRIKELGYIFPKSEPLILTNGNDVVKMEWKTNSFEIISPDLYIKTITTTTRVLSMVTGVNTNFLRGEQLGEIVTNYVPVKVEYKR